MERPERDRAERGLALCDTLLGRLDAMIGRIADHVDERVVELLDQGAVEFGILSLQHEPDILPLLDGEIANQPRHLLERSADRHHPQ